MNARAPLDKLRDLGMKLTADGDRLHVDAQPDPLQTR